ncbi:MAG: hypothetical protein J6W38_04870 [Prevotella sp.]|nr:hypothetical protein [Prevotella sp.]
MTQLDEQLDREPTEAAIKEMAELRIRNLQAFDELRSFNDTGKFLNLHPLLSSRSELSKLIDLFRRDPAEFLHQHKLTEDNVKRYRSYLKRSDRKDRRTADREALARHQERQRLFKMVLEEFNNKK